MEVRLRHSGDVVILGIDGKLTLTDGARTLRSQLRQLLDSNERKVVLDLVACQYIDSAGLGELATALLRVQKAGGRLVLLNPQSRVKELLNVTRLLRVFTVCSSEDEAVQALSSG